MNTRNVLFWLCRKLFEKTVNGAINKELFLIQMLKPSFQYFFLFCTEWTLTVTKFLKDQLSKLVEFYSQPYVNLGLNQRPPPENEFWAYGVQLAEWMLQVGSCFFPHLSWIARSRSYTKLTRRIRFNTVPTGKYTLKVNNRNTRARCEICSELS